MTPTPKDISKWASDSYRDLAISEVVTNPKLQRWAWDFFNTASDVSKDTLRCCKSLIHMLLWKSLWR